MTNSPRRPATESWRYIDPDELIKRIDAASQPKQSDRVNTSPANSMVSRIDRASAKTRSFKDLPAEAQERLKEQGYFPASDEQAKIEKLKTLNLLPASL